MATKEPFVLGSIVKRLRETAPSFERRVGGTAKLSTVADDDNDIPVPHAFVVPLAEVAGARSNMGEAQRVVESFAIIVAVENANTKDGLGMMAADKLRVIRGEIFAALLGWETAGWHDTISYVGGRHLTMNRARLWHQFDFQLAYYVSPTRAADAGPVIKEVYRRMAIEGADLIQYDGDPVVFPAGAYTKLSEDAK